MRATTSAEKWAASRAIEVDSESISVSSPPMVPASPIGERARNVIEGVEGVAVVRASRTDRTADLAQVEGVQGLPRLEHDVVGDIDGQRDRTHAAGTEPALHPARRDC